MSFSQIDIQKFSTLKGDENELFDLSVKGMQEIYDDVVSKQKPEVISRDTTSFEEIKDSVINAAKKHAGDGIVILSGANRHMVGGIMALQEHYNIEYVPVKGGAISTETEHYGKNIDAKDIRVQMERELGVAKHLGCKTLEDLRLAIESKPHDPSKQTLVVIGLGEIPPHSLKTHKEKGDKALAALEGIIGNLETKPSFIQYIGEDLVVDNIRKVVEKPQIDNYPRNAFLQKMHQSGIPVEIDAFGHRDRMQTKNFGTAPREMGEWTKRHFNAIPEPRFR